MDSGRRLDMSHGFIKSIVKNQIDRDEYHKFMEEKRQQTEKTLSQAAQEARQTQREVTGKKRRPAPVGNIYVPPHRRDRTGGDVRSEGSRMSVDHEDNGDEEDTMGITDVEENELRERARARIKAQCSDLPTMEFGKAPSPSTQPSKPLFLLTLLNGEGENVEVAVMNSDNAARLAKMLSRKYGYSEQQCRMLRNTLEEELEKRLES